MKRIAFLFLFVIGLFSMEATTAQTRTVGLSSTSNDDNTLFISTNYRYNAYWSDLTDSWKTLTEKEDPTLFIFNKDMTMFKHRTRSITSDYFIISEEYDATNKQYELEVVSDVGNKYTMILDLEDENLRFIYKKGGKSYLVQHEIKTTWKK